jgi:hypothetical protein
MDIDPYAAESETPTEVDTDEFMIMGGKRTPLSTHDPRWVTKRTGQPPFTNLVVYPGP